MNRLIVFVGIAVFIVAGFVFRQLIKEPNVCHNLAQTGDYVKDLDKVNRCIENGKLDNKRLSAVYVLRGIAHSSLDQEQLALADLEKSLSLDPGNGNAFIIRGMLYSTKGKLKQAIQDLDRSIQILGNNNVAYMYRGIAHALLGNNQMAIHDFDQSIVSNPENPLAYALRGAAYGELKQYKKAIDDCNHAIALDDKGIEIFDIRASVYAKSGNFDAAMQDVDRAIALDPGNARGYFTKAKVFRGMKQYDKALQGLEKSMDVDRKYVATYNALAWLQATCPDAMHRDGKNAIKMARIAISYEKSPEHYDTLAASLACDSQYDQAVAAQRQAIQMAKEEGFSKDIVDKMERRLKIYGENKPFITEEEEL